MGPANVPDFCRVVRTCRGKSGCVRAPATRANGACMTTQNPLQHASCGVPNPARIAGRCCNAAAVGAPRHIAQLIWNRYLHGEYHVAVYGINDFDTVTVTPKHEFLSIWTPSKLLNEC